MAEVAAGEVAAGAEAGAGAGTGESGASVANKAAPAASSASSTPKRSPQHPSRKATSSRRGGGASAGFGGKPGAAVRAGHARTLSYVKPTSARETALVLIVAIILARLLLTNQLQQFWAALWSTPKPLGSALPAKAGGASTTGSTKS